MIRDEESTTSCARSASSVEKPQPLGAIVEEGGTTFRVYCTTRTPKLRLVRTNKDADTHEMQLVGTDLYEVHVPGCQPGARYMFELDGSAFPDPFSRFQPEGVHGASMVVDSRFEWRNSNPNPVPEKHVMYELHVGTFTAAGTYAAAAERLADVAELGVTTIELMPLAAFAGDRGWGYDGVALFAPHACYGTPTELRAFIDAAHGYGLAVILDVVYNHLGPAGNYLAQYSEDYFLSAKTAWGDAPNFGHPAFRTLVLQNVDYWLCDFRFDGLRLDATHAIIDPSAQHILTEITSRLASHEPPRQVFAEDNRNDPKVVTEAGFTGLWADDFHHQMRVTLTGEQDGYYAAYKPGVDGIARTINRGWFFEGQGFGNAGEPRGESADGLPAVRFIYCIQNHDQIGNRAFGDRLCQSISTDAYCAVSTLLLFLPMTPLLFMGQEWAATSPFLHFTDHDQQLAEAIFKGRCHEFKDFAAFKDPRSLATIPNPQEEETFLQSKLLWDERTHPPHQRVLQLYKKLIALRKTDAVLERSSREQLVANAQGNVLRVHRWLGVEQRLLLINFGPEAVSMRALVGTTMQGVEPVFTSAEVAEGQSANTEDLGPQTAVILTARWPALDVLA